MKEHQMVMKPFHIHRFLQLPPPLYEMDIIYIFQWNQRRLMDMKCHGQAGQGHLPLHDVCRVLYVRRDATHLSYFITFNFHNPMMR